MKLFLQKKCKIFVRWGLRPQTLVPPAAGGFAPKPPASGSWGLHPHWPPAAGGSAPRPPKQSPLLRISGYAPGADSHFLSHHPDVCCKWTALKSR